ncbi:GFA family protein [Inquilinus limosus]|uniref:GFA family protein n=1 Tax=Inquilinus limosus TaxID=171674 RepID=UPI003F181F97
MSKTALGKVRKAPAEVAEGRCLCGRVRIEIGVPARWAWHDHSRDSRLAHGAAYATYVGCWRSRVRIVKGESALARFVEEDTGRTRSFCRHCGTPVLYERSQWRQMVNIPRALFETRTGREPLYHIAIEQAPEWTYRGEPLRPLKGFPGVVWTRPKRKKRPLMDDEF